MITRVVLCTVLVVALGSCPCRGAATQETAPLGVFAVLGHSPELAKVVPMGTAFLIDAEQGYLLTAAHVLVDAQIAEWRSAEPQAKVVLWASTDLAGGRFEFEINAQLVVCGQAGPLQPLTGTKDDWALLRVTDLDALDALAGFRAISLVRDQTPESLVPGQFDVRFSGMLSGYPQMGRVSTDAPALVQAYWQSDLPLRRAKCDVRKGMSGGPTWFEDQSVAKLLGVAIREDPAAPGYLYVLPGCAMLEELSKTIPRSSRLNTVINFLLSLGENPPPRGIVAFRALSAIRNLNAIEQWQLRVFLCENSTLPEPTTKFLYDCLAALPGDRFYLDKTLQCRADIERVIIEDSTKIAQSARATNNVADASAARAVLEAASVISGWTHRDDSRNAARSRLLTNAAIVRSALLGPDSHSDEGLRQLKVAYQLDPRNPDIPVAVALAAPDLTKQAQLALTRPYVSVMFSDARPALVRAGEDRIVFENIWALGGTPGPDGDSRYYAAVKANPPVQPYIILDEILLNSNAVPEK